MYVRSADLRCKHCLFHINKQMCPCQINSQQWLTVIIRLSVELHCMPKVTSVWYEQTHPSGFPSSKGKWFESLRECHYNHIYLHLFSPSWTLFESSDHSTLWQRVTFPALLKAQLKAMACWAAWSPVSAQDSSRKTWLITNKMKFKECLSWGEKKPLPFYLCNYVRIHIQHRLSVKQKHYQSQCN